MAGAAAGFTWRAALICPGCVYAGMQAAEQMAALRAGNARLAAELEVERGKAVAVVTAVSGKAEEVGTSGADLRWRVCRAASLSIICLP